MLHSQQRRGSGGAAAAAAAPAAAEDDVGAARWRRHVMMMTTMAVTRSVRQLRCQLGMSHLYQAFAGCLGAHCRRQPQHQASVGKHPAQLELPLTCGAQGVAVAAKVREQPR